MHSISFRSSRSDFFRLIEDFEDFEDFENSEGANGFSQIKKCGSDVVASLIAGTCDKEGCFGKVIIDNGKAFKMNMKSSYSAIIKDKIFLDRVLHQNVMLIIVDSIIKEQRPDLVNRYPMVYDLFKCDKFFISVYNSFNIGTISELISGAAGSNLDTPAGIAFLDRELLRCIFQISEIIGFLSTNYNFMHNDLKSNNVMAHMNESTKNIEYKMIDLDSAYIELEKITILVNNKKYNENENLVHRINEKDRDHHPKDDDARNVFVSIKPRGFLGYEEEGKVFRESYRKYINIDIYILIFSFIFDQNIIKIMDNLPMFNQFISYIFKEPDIEKIRATIYGKSKFIPKNIVGPYNYIITNEINLRLDIFEYIDSTIRSIEKDFDVNICK